MILTAQDTAPQFWMPWKIPIASVTGNAILSTCQLHRVAGQNPKGGYMSKAFKKGYYFADTATGVYFASEGLEDPAQEVISARDFADSLSGVEDGETICAFFDESNFDVLAEIEAEYGVAV